MWEIRLGDIIDDYCVKCKRIMNHAVVSMLNNEPAKVRCRTCHNDHDYRHEQAPPPKVDTRKQALFNEVLAKVAPAEVAAPVVAEPVDEEPAGEPLEETPAVEPAKPKKAAVAAKAPAKAAVKASAKIPVKGKVKTKGRK
jgi:hypothetical protein